MNTAIIGGGASGMTAAVFSSRCGEAVTVFERSDKVLKKLLATGNGRCNLSNTDLSPSHYYTNSPDVLKEILSNFSESDEKAFFHSIGIPFVCEEGRIYPRSRRASAVVDALRFEADRLGVKIMLNSFIRELRPVRGGFTVCGKFFDRIIIASGGSAAPMFGTDGNSYKLLEAIGHKLHKPYPSLVPLKTQESTKQLKGVRTQCCVFTDGYLENGEVQFTDYGLSGIAVMQLSRLFTQNKRFIYLDLMPENTPAELQQMLFARAKQFSDRTAENFLTGILHKSLACYVLDRCKISLTEKCGTFSETKITMLSNLLKKLPFTINSTCGFENAQTTLGGGELSQFDPKTLESRLCHGIYCTGEALDCAGDCGGYNLHWAWLTGFLAGNGANI